ncbi:MAG: prepilin-type N-terminal cleavage/methylation domain-containing protein [bacterium]
MNRRGFTLIEVVIATMLFITTIASFAYFLKSAQNYLDLSGKYSKALYIGRSKMETLRKEMTASELEMIEVTVTWDAKHPPFKLVSLRSKY